MQTIEDKKESLDKAHTLNMRLSSLLAICARLEDMKLSKIVLTDDRTTKDIYVSEIDISEVQDALREYYNQQLALTCLNVDSLFKVGD